MTAGPRSRPPDLPNFSYEGWLGGGGFADVFLYRQKRPDRLVAVKVLRTESLDSDGLRAFDSEADLMAKVSAHPYIVTIYGADVAPDGRPFIVMEYYAKPHFGRRLENGPLSVQEVLRLGIRIGSAVETAHRAGILHRDVKPDNILVNDYDRPGLTDFGIAEGRGFGAGGQGLTLGFAPPEAIDGSDGGAGSIAGDVYSLAATLYKLLSGQAPYEMRGGDNSQSALVARTLSGAVPRLERSDVPHSLDLLLQHALAKRPADRPNSAESFARALQAVEQELRLPSTEFELAGVGRESTGLPVSSGTDADATRARAVQVVRQDTPAGLIDRVAPGDDHVTGAPALPPVPRPEPPQAADTVARVARIEPSVRADSQPADVPAARHRRVLAAVAGAVGLLVVIVAVVVTAAGGGGAPASTTTTVEDPGALIVADVPPIPSAVTVSLLGNVATVTWLAPGAKDGDSYLVLRTDAGHDGQAGMPASTPSVEVPGIEPGVKPCFQVVAVRGAAQSSSSTEECAP